MLIRACSYAKQDLVWHVPGCAHSASRHDLIIINLFLAFILPPQLGLFLVPFSSRSSVSSFRSSPFLSRRWARKKKNSIRNKTSPSISLQLFFLPALDMRTPEYSFGGHRSPRSTMGAKPCSGFIFSRSPTPSPSNRGLPWHLGSSHLFLVPGRATRPHLNFSVRPVTQV